MATPPLPPGFQLEPMQTSKAPPLPPGFQLEPMPQKPTLMQSAGDVAQGVGETALNLLTGAAGQVAGGLAGLAALPTAGPEGAARAVGRVQEAMTYQPRGWVGKGATQDLGEAFGQLAKPGEKLAEAGHPAAGAAVTTALQGVLPLALPGVLGAVGKYGKEVAGAVKEGNALARGERLPTKATQPPATAGTTPPSVGAAGTPAHAEIAAAIEKASPELRAAVEKMPVGQVNMEALGRHVEGDRLPVPVRLTEGQASGDPMLISMEKNRRGAVPELVDAFNQQNEALKANLPAIRDMAAPDSFATTKVDAGDNLIKLYQREDAVRTAEIRGAYKALEDQNAGSFPVDGVAMAEKAFTDLHKKLATNFLDPAVARTMEALRNGEPLNFEQYEALRSTLAEEARGPNRSAAKAASIVRDAVEELPLREGTGAELKALADTARKLAKARFDRLRADPAYKAVTEDKAHPDNFFDQYVVRGKTRHVRAMQKTLADHPEALQELAAGTMHHLSEAAGIRMGGEGTFSQAGYNRVLDTLDKTKKLEAVLPQEARTQVRTLGNVARATQYQPAGSFVNNSGSAVAYIAEKAAGGVLGAIDKVTGLPVKELVMGAAKGAIEKGRATDIAGKALSPGAGVLRPRAKGQPKTPTLRELRAAEQRPAIVKTMATTPGQKQGPTLKNPRGSRR